MTTGEPVRRAVAAILAGTLALAACSSGGGSVEAFCESVQKFVDTQFFDAFMEIDPAEFADEIEEQRDLLNALVDDAPSEISDDAESAAESIMPVYDALTDVDPTGDEAIEDAITEVFTEEIDPEVEAASDRVSEFALAECGIDL